MAKRRRRHPFVVIVHCLEGETSPQRWDGLIGAPVTRRTTILPTHYSRPSVVYDVLSSFQPSSLVTLSSIYCALSRILVLMC